MKKISLLVNCLNEFNNLKKNIIPIAHFFDEVIIVDMASNDGSRELVQEIGNAKFFEIQKMGYVEPARQFGIEACSYDYIFILDADEVPSKNMINDIRCFREGTANEFLFLAELNGIMIPRLNSMFGKDITWGKFSPDNDKQLRFFRKDLIEVSDVIHAGLKFKKSVEQITIPYSKGYYIYHYHSSTAIEFISRLVRYSEFENNKSNGVDSFSVKNAIKAFVKEYFYCKGFKHGKVGFALAYILSLREFLKGKR